MKIMKLEKAHKSLILAVLPIILFLIAYAISISNIQIITTIAITVFAVGSVLAVIISLVLSVMVLKKPSNDKRNESRNMAILALILDVVWIAVIIIFIYYALQPPILCVLNATNALSTVPC